MAARAYLISDILRILTPEEISHLTTTSEAGCRMPLTEVIQKYQRGELVDFSKRLSAYIKAKEEENNVLAFPGVAPAEITESEKTGTSPTDTAPGSFLEENQNFILSEKKRFEQARAKMREKEVLKMYQKTAAVDLQTERSLKEDLSKSTQLGILIDKKQA